MVNKDYRIGYISENRFGRKMQIIEYNGARDVLIKWLDGTDMTKRVLYKNFKEGIVKNPFDKTVHGVGYLGIGVHTDYDKNRVYNKEIYRVWKGIIDRCYVTYNYKRNYVYEECSICEEWKNYNNFADWYVENYYKIENHMMCLDKDILSKGNKEYSPDKCVFVPQFINKTFTKTNKLRGRYPIGVSCDKSGIRADCNYGNKKTKFLGYYKNEKDAFNSYKKFKEDYIKSLADEYKDSIPEKLYNAMYKYQVEITD